MEIKVIDVLNIKELPKLYIMFPDNLTAAIKRLGEIEEKLLVRGRRIPRPYRVFRWMWKGRGSLAVELRDVNEPETEAVHEVD